MGYDASAYVIVGVPVNRKEFWESRAVPGCHHKHTNKFCPECGKPAREREEVEIEGWEEGDEKYRGLEMAFAGCEADEGVLGVRLAYGSPSKSIVMFSDKADGDGILKALKGTKFEGREIKPYLVFYESY
jgi:hypothetical protein